LGPVFRAYDQERDRLVAIKLFSLELPPRGTHQLVTEFEPHRRRSNASRDCASVATGTAGSFRHLAVEHARRVVDSAVRDYGPAPAVDAAGRGPAADALDFAASVTISHGAHPRDAA
jgi:hypothetical protein